MLPPCGFASPPLFFLSFFAAENPPGTFLGLVDGGVYWVYVSRDDEEEQKDKERMKQASRRAHIRATTSRRSIALRDLRTHAVFGVCLLTSRCRRVIVIAFVV